MLPEWSNIRCTVSSLAELLGESAGIKAVRDKLRRLLERQQDVRRVPPVLIEGETGTGKGLLARVIHRTGPRRDGPFVDVNCAAIPETLLEAEMFGFERGAFTDARRAKPGLLQAAHRGTIFLDEVGLLPEALQAKLLKVLEERAVRRLGSTRDEHIDVWILTASNEDLRTAIRERRFREDLYHRLAVLTVTLPPLRERGDDILALAEHFLERACVDYGLPPKTLTEAARGALRAYDWPGNVRELANLMERIALLSPELAVTAETLALPAPAPEKKPGAGLEDMSRSLEDAARDRVAEVLGETNWNISHTAAILRISRNTLRARIEKYGLRQEVAAEPTRSARPRASALAAPASATAPAASPPPTLRWERRRVTLLRAALASSTGSDTLLETNRALEILIEKVVSFGGHLEGISPRGVLAAFGLDSTEDAPSLAAHAALAIQKAVARARQEDAGTPSVTIGIHLEQCLVGLGLRAAELDVGAWQKVVEALTALVERGEPGSILVSEVAARFLERRFELLDVGSGAIGRVFALAGRASTGLGRHWATFVGRHGEIDVLWSRLESAMRGQGQIVGITGEAGIGKTRLLHEFHQSLVGKRIGYVEAQCLSYGPATPYLPVLQALRASCGIADADESEVAARVNFTLQELGLDPARGGPYLFHLLGLKPGAERLAGLEPDVIKARVFETLRHLWVGRSRQLPLVLAIEDLQWIDSISEEFFTSLAEIVSGSRILLVSTYRAGYRPTWIERSNATQVALQPLAPDESERILRSVLGGNQISDALADLIIAKADGNPFFVEELARAVREQGGLAVSATVPDTIHEVLLGRIGRLRPEDKQVIEIAAVVGKDVSYSIVEAVAGIGENELRAAFTRLKAAEFLQETSSGPDIEYAFKHVLTHEVAYDNVPPERRRILHARIVEAIEALYPDRLGLHTDRLAHHAYRGEVWDKAVEYLRRSGRRALFASATGQAVEIFERALVALRWLPQAPETLHKSIALRLNLRDALWSLGHVGKIHDQLVEAEAMAQRLGDQRGLATVACYLCHYFWAVGELDAALQAGERALTIAGSVGDALLLAETDLYRGVVFLAQGDSDRTAQILQRVLLELEALAMGKPSPGNRARAIQLLVRCFLTRALAELGRFEEGIACGEECLRLAEQSGTAFGLATALAGLGSLYLRKAQPHSAIPLLERGLEVCRNYSINNWLPTIGASLGAAYAVTGRADDGGRLLEQAVDLGTRMGILATLSLWRIYLGDAYFRAGRVAEALEEARGALALCRARGEHGYEAWALHLLGRIAASQESLDPAEARTNYLGALNLAERFGMRPLVVRSVLGLARLHGNAGDSTMASAYRERAVHVAAEMGLELALLETS